MKVSVVYDLCILPNMRLKFQKDPKAAASRYDWHEIPGVGYVRAANVEDDLDLLVDTHCKMGKVQDKIELDREQLRRGITACIKNSSRYAFVFLY